MPGSLLRTLPLLLCLVVVSWGVCPCVFARMLSLQDATAGEPAPEPSPCGCCKTRPAARGPRTSPDEAPTPPQECPCCERGGALRDLPPPGADVVPDLPAAPLPAPTPAAVTTLFSEVALRGAIREATGPPRALAPHACPVGIVRLLL